ncbi:hypothetical protein G159_02050 [Planococcus glaciei CHR43]|uniref:hypothetical protein n=1 Tax=Planococcus glaciei TaxID=459472 RepID=UPI0003DF03A3|nr:hypothetical protein [Planococcus glaciei]ETP70333.1 hypothetical protein G159_02050 [Planococcus glaciei CHR43]
MKLKFWLVSLLVISTFLTACGSESANSNESSENTSSESEETAEETEASKDIEAAEETEQEETNSEDVQEDDSLKATNTYTNKELGITGEIGPIKYEIPGVQLKIMEPKDQATADLFGVGIGEEVHAFTVQVVGENTSDEDMSFYLGQAIAVTNTKEQLEPDMLLSEHIEGEYLGQVRHEGFNVYILKNSKVNELESIELRISAPSDSNYEIVGEDVSHTIEVNK